MKFLSKDEQLVLFLYLTALIVIVVGIYGQWWALSSVLNYIPEVIMLSLIPLLLWGFRKRITRALHTESVSAAQSIPVAVNSNVGLTEIQHDPIRHYTTRDELRFHHMLAIAHDSVEMLASTFTIVTEQYYDEVVYVLNRGISFTFLLLDPESREIKRQRGLYHRSEDLKYQIRNSLKVLCDLKRKFPDKIVVKLYDARAPRSITVIDRENPDNAWIRVERRELDSVPNSRPSDAWFRREEHERFDNFLQEYQDVLGQSKDYQCPPTS
jgi:hypothetical protein